MNEPAALRPPATRAAGARLALTQFAAVFRKEVRQTTRDRRVMFMLVVAPLAQTILFGYAVDFEVDRVPTVVADADRSPESREHVRRLLADGTLRRTESVPDTAEAERRLESGGAAAAVVLPPGFQRDLLAGRPAEVQVLLDGTDPNRSTVAAMTVSRYFGEVAGELLRERLAARGLPPPAGVSVVPRIRFNPSLKTPPFMVPGVMVMLLLIVTTVVTAMGLAREREMGTLEQVLVTPIKPLYLLLGKMAPFVVVGMLDVVLVLAAGTWLFDLPARGSLWVLAAGMVLYLLCTLGIGLFISTVSRTQQQAFLGGMLFILPAVLLSGVATPVRSMPPWLQTITYANPVRYIVDVVRGNLLRGAGCADLWPQFVSLGAIGAGILVFATLRFRKQLA